MGARIYDTSRWDQARERTLARDGHACTVGRLLGGVCHPLLDVHHLVPLSEGGAEYDDANLITVCRSHHRQLEALRKHLLREPTVRRCNHRHTYPHAREECERRLNAQVAA